MCQCIYIYVGEGEREGGEGSATAILGQMFSNVPAPPRGQSVLFQVPTEREGVLRLNI